MKHINIYYLVLLIILTGCTKDDVIQDPVKRNISGYIQKGPFLSGTSISISELNTDLSQTGTTFSTSITSNNGNFAINNIELISEYVSLRADGFYYNEVLGETSLAQITLYSLSNLTNAATLNVNVLSHLEKPRVEYLMSQGSSFNDAKIQAQSEVLTIFNINSTDIQYSELLDISQPGVGNAILLASSVILQGYRTEAELTEIMAGISLDLREDGELNNATLGSRLINHAVYLNSQSIRNNLENRFQEIGVDAEVPAFETYLNNFIETSDFEITESLIEYPSLGIYGSNLLDLDLTNIPTGEYSVAASLSLGASITLKIYSLDGNDNWGYAVGSSLNWITSDFDYANHSFTFTSIDSDADCDLNMLFFTPGQYLIEYFEMNATEPTLVKEVSVTP